MVFFSAVLIPRLKEANKHLIIHVAYETEAFIIKLHHDLWQNSLEHFYLMRQTIHYLNSVCIKWHMNHCKFQWQYKLLQLTWWYLYTSFLVLKSSIEDGSRIPERTQIHDLNLTNIRDDKQHWKGIWSLNVMRQRVNIFSTLCTNKWWKCVYISNDGDNIMLSPRKWLCLLFLIAICVRLSASKFPKQLSGQTHLLYGLEHTKVFFVIEKIS